MERGRSSGYGVTPVHRRTAAALQAKAGRSVPRPGSVGHVHTAVLDRVGSGVIRDPIGLGLGGGRSGLRPSSAGPSDASKLLQFSSASKVKGGLSGAVGSAAATAVGPVAAARMTSQSRLGAAKYSSASHSSMWPPHPPTTFGSDRRNAPAGTGSGSEDGLATAAVAPAGAATAEAAHGSGVETKHARGASAPSTVDAQVVRRSKEQKANSAERLNMDNQQLGACPRLMDEEKLRLLNYQSNQICTIENLEGLPNLIFLDLYNNRIEQIAGLDHVQGLRVLMLGKNRLSAIENLDGLTRLDVLDLHSNQIAEVERLSHLTALRVLNLAGNRISCLHGVEGLVSLTELNLRRNVLTEIRDLSGLVSLQRLFLSHNQLPSTRTLEPLGALPQLLELSVEHNPLCSVTTAVYRPELLAHLTATLAKLDAQEVTPSERVAAQEAHVARVSAAAAASGTNSQSTDDTVHTLVSRQSPRHNVRSKPYSISETSSRDATDNTIVQPACTMGQGMNVDHVRSREVGNGLPRRPSSPRESARVARIRDVMWDWEVRTRHADRVHPGTAGPQQRHSESDSGTATSLGFYDRFECLCDFFAHWPGGEEDADDPSGSKRDGPGARNQTQLSVYGWSALSALTDPAHAHISSLSLQYVAVERMIAGNLSAKLSALPALTSISFAHNHLRSIGELECLIGGFLDARAASSLAEPDAAGRCRLRSLTVRENSLCELGLYRDLVIRMCEGGKRTQPGGLGTLRYLNGVAITQTERSAAMELFAHAFSKSGSAGSSGTNAGVWSEFEQPYIGSGYTFGIPPGQRGTMSYEHAQRVAEHAVDVGLKAAKEMEEKTNLLNELWPSAVADVIETTLDELDDLENWMALSLKKLV